MVNWLTWAGARESFMLSPFSAEYILVVKDHSHGSYIYAADRSQQLDYDNSAGISFVANENRFEFIAEQFPCLFI